MSLARMLDLSGKTALVTGGSRGLGLQMAEVLGELGAKLAITARKADELEAAAAHLRGLGVAQVLPVACDLADPAAVPGLVDRVVEGLGPIDILVNNAGTTWGAPTAEHSLAAWDKVIAVNLTSVFVLTQEVGRRCMLPRRSGRVVNIASIQGLTGGYPQGMPTLAYNTSKGGIVNFTRTLANEWAAHDIRVNAIAPGFFPTRMTRPISAALGDDATARMAPLGRAGGPEDLKGALALFAGDACLFITGQTLAVDGGVTAAFAF